MVITNKKDKKDEIDIPSLSKKETRSKSIVWIIHMYPPENNAGAEIMLHTINTFLISKGWKITILIPSFPLKTYEGIKIVEFKDKKEVSDALETASIIGSHLKFSGLSARIAKQLNIPLVLIMHNSFQIPYLKDILKIIPKQQLHLINNSVWINKHYNFLHIDSEIVYPPVFYEDFQLSTNTRKNVTLINCTLEKGGELLIRLAKAMPDIDFLGVLGGYGNQIVVENIPNLKYHKHTVNIKSIYEKTDIILMPSSYESWGRVAVEAMSAGIPVVANPVSGLKESLDYAGIFADIQSLQAWISAIRKLKTDPWFYNRKSEEGKIRSKELNPLKQLISVEKWLSDL